MRPTKRQPRPTAKVSRLNLRSAPAHEALIRRAAAVSRKSVSEFVLESACAAAERLILDQRLITVDQATFAAFNAALDRPARLNPRLRALFARKAPWER